MPEQMAPVLAYQGADGFPVVVLVQFAGHDDSGLRLVTRPGCCRPAAAGPGCSRTPTGPG